LSRESGHQVVDGRWAVFQQLLWIAHQYIAGRLVAATVTISEPCRMHCAVQMRDGEE
jgi:hypothetical protein